MVGLGKMGANMTTRLLKGGHQMVVYNRDLTKVKVLVEGGAIGAESLEDLANKFTAP